jgi:hypothetical protein
MIIFIKYVNQQWWIYSETKIKYAFYSSNSHEDKKILYRQFKKIFIQKTEYGRDYFQGDIELMNKCIVKYFEI